MKRKDHFWVGPVMVLVFLAFLVASCVHADGKVEGTISGIVTKVRDPRGKVHVFIETDAGPFEVAKGKGRGIELKKFVHRRVLATGIIKERNGVKRIIVYEYKIIE